MNWKVWAVLGGGVGGGVGGVWLARRRRQRRGAGQDARWSAATDPVAATSPPPAECATSR